MKELLKKYREIIRYMLFGVITTAVSMGVYFAILTFAEHSLAMDPDGSDFYAVRIIAQVLQWISGVLVSFFTNKKWVFESKNTEKHQTAKELLKFTLSRVSTFVLDSALTIGCVWFLMKLNYQPFTFVIEITADIWSKIIASIAVIIANYILSKYLVFKKDKKDGNAVKND